MTILDIAHACKALRSKEDTRDLVVEMDHVRPLNMQPQKYPQQAVEQPQMEKQRGDRVETSGIVETSSRRKFQAKWVEGAHATIPLGERWGDVKQYSQELQKFGQGPLSYFCFMDHQLAMGPHNIQQKGDKCQSDTEECKAMLTTEEEAQQQSQQQHNFPSRKGSM